MTPSADFIVVGAGSAGCIAAAELARRNVGRVLVLEAGPTDNHPLVKMPFGLAWLMGSKRDWRFKTSPQKGLGGRQLAVPRGRMLGGSGSINSMVWFRGRRDDFDGWGVKGWSWRDVEPAFESVEAKLQPKQMTGVHPLVQALSGLFGGNSDDAPTPEYESAGIFCFNMRNARRWSAADAFLRPAQDAHDLKVMTGCVVDRVEFDNGQAKRVVLVDGTKLSAAKGVILSAGSISSPAILMRSGVGPEEHLKELGIELVHSAQEVGENLHDHPAAGLHFAGPGSGYGLTFSQLLAWALAPFRYLFTRTGRFASPTVEGGAFFNARGDTGAPDVQCHFIPFMLDWKGSRFTLGSGYFADVCVCRPKSRGRLRLVSSDPRVAPEIDLGLFQDVDDVETLVAGLKRLRTLMNKAAFGPHRAPEVHPGPAVSSDDALRQHIKTRGATAYHPVGTLRMGDGTAPVTPRLAVAGVRGLWVADASVMPAVTSANTNAPSMMIGYRAAEFISEDAA
ncbi:GMC family oxidoreductase N-terminal domain-containing protein [Aliiroseovarius subalbicans]|uniref:GMC family oxidoreductase n=1 Tax=Aliiroseovarius subalbicans TaxID=2925840 RepID=UPI001F56A083|nr:GMC family oxidoreductase N-terminal domain-containing protein [Aliiroseovarius subalbicans]MCI2401129.1 GMC family oxidoreductase N-terminal domain-containing protein [Aliiroseovarius subalbicans]